MLIDNIMSTNIIYNCNAKRSPFDKRDYIIKNNRNCPDALDLRHELLPVRNQGEQGTCYAQSAACAKEWQEKRDYDLDEYLSPQFFYNNRNNKYDDQKDNDEGMYGRDVMKILKNIGICKEKNYNYGRIEDKKNIPEHLYVSAKKHCIKSYAKVLTIEQLKIALFYCGPCLIAFPVYNYGSEMWIQNDAESFKGGHAMTVVGYTNDSFIIRNSWGEEWGDNGYCYYNFDDWGLHWELWSMVDDDTIIDKPEPEPKPKPKPEPEPEPEPKPKPKPEPRQNTDTDEASCWTLGDCRDLIRCLAIPYLCCSFICSMYALLRGRIN